MKELFPETFKKKSKLSISQEQLFKVLCNLFILYTKLWAVENIL